MTAACGLCERELGDAFLCGGCTRALAERLERLPQLYRLLGVFLAPASRSGADRVSSGHAAASLPVNEAVLELRYGGIVLVVEGWRADVQAVRGWGEPAIVGDVEERVRRAARWLGMTLEWIASSYPPAGELAREIREVEGAALAIVGPPGEDRGRRIGQCVAQFDDGTVCGADLRHWPGETALICPLCRCEYASTDFLMLKNFQPEEAA